MRVPLSIRHVVCRQWQFPWPGCLLAMACGVAGAAPVAGLSPAERPAGAPVVRQHTLMPERTVRLTEGVSRPLPKGLGFLKDQGAWYTPFDRPGMGAPYDLRGLRQLRSPSADVGRSPE